MKQKTIQEGWKIRNVRYEDIHKVEQLDLDALVKSLEINDGEIVVDLMSGYGAVTREILKHYNDVHPILVDMFEEQLNRSYREIDSPNAKRLLCDSRNLVLEDSSVDRVVMKMGLHEVPKNDQRKIINHAYRILKKGGILSLWDVMAVNLEGQILFQDIIREKDRLAGFDTLVKNRYFLREDEIRQYLHDAGFNGVEFFKEIKYRLSTEKRLDAEFGGDESKLQKWNEYIRLRVPERLKNEINYKDNGRTIEMTFRKGIIRGRK